LKLKSPPHLSHCAMTSTVKTLDYPFSNNSNSSAPSSQSQREGPSSDSNVLSLSLFPHKKKLSRPPPIPLSPPTKPDQSATVDVTLRKFELDAAGESWAANTVKRAEFMNSAHSLALMAKMGLTAPKNQYHSLIAHSRHKTQIAELLADGRSLHIVQRTESGCPAVRNPAAKKGCWCIDEMKKRRKHSASSAAAATANSTATVSGTAAAAQRRHPQHTSAVAPKVAANHSLNALGALNGLNPLRLAANPALLLQQQKAMKIMNFYSNPMLRLNAATKVPSAVDIAQNLILSARSQPMFHSSNRMQQIRMQQLLSARTTTTTTTAASATATAAAATAEKSKDGVLGARQHRDTVVFSKESTTTEPPPKRRKKSRWSDK